MILKRLFGSKPKPDRIPADQDSLVRIVRGDQDTALRREACRRITRLPELRELAASDIDAGVREIAMAHYRNLLCGLDETAPSPADRLAEIAALDDQRVIEQVAASAREAEIRLAAIGRLESPAAIAASALEDALAANRIAAAERLEDRVSLEQLAKAAGKRDKNVYRIARRKLKDIAEREALPERVRTQCADLCEKLERLGRFDSWTQDRGMLDLLDRQWAELEPQADDGWKERYRALRTGFLAAYEDYRQAHQAQIAAEEAREQLREDRKGLLEALGACAELTDEAEMEAESRRISEGWETLARLPDREQAALDRSYSELAARVAQQREELSARRRRKTRLRKLVAAARKALEQTKPLEKRRIRTLIDDAASLLDTPGADKETAQQFSDLRDKLETRLHRQREHAEQRLAELPEKLDELAAALEAGELKHADPLFQSAQAALDLIRASGLSRKACDDASERLRVLAPRLRELQQWRKWGSDQHRQGLCQTMEELGRSDIPLEAMALRLHDLQMEWKGLDKVGSPVNQHLWDRFHALSEQVYARCKPHLDAQAAERDANREQREKLCQQFEAFLEQVDWERIDWKKAMRAEREMRQTWAACGAVEGRHRKALEKRFHTAIKRLDQHLSAERARNQAHKQDLIARVEALVEEPDLEGAMEETKRLQRQWHTTVPARQKEENKLWQRFRAACDAIFARRRERQEAHQAELEQNLQQRRAICDEADHLATAAAEPEEIERVLRDLEARWRDAEGLPLPRQPAGELARRWREAQERARGRRRELLASRHRDALDLLARQAALCDRLELGLAGQAAGKIGAAAAHEQWAAMPKQRDPDLQTSIARRFLAAVEALQSGDGAPLHQPERLAANGARRAEICLRLEILAQIDSPPEHTQERLAFQVDRLKERMREGEKDPLEGTTGLLEEWYLCGPAPVSEAPNLEQRFQRARAALESGGLEHSAA